MKKIVYLVLFSMGVYSSVGQTRTQVAQLATLGKVWGLLKYYHPAAAKGNPDWDSALVQMIGLAEQTSTTQALDSLLESWYRSLPPAGLSTARVKWGKDAVTSTFTEKDIQRLKVAAWLKTELVRLYQYHSPDTNFYVTRYYGGYHYDQVIHTENGYDSFLYPDRAMRLLALFRYWNTIAYFYPHKGRMAAWDRVLNDYIPRFWQAKDAAAYRYAVKALIHELPDSHSFVKENDGAAYLFYPFRIDFIDGKYLIGQCDDSVANRWDYRVGDEILAINGQPTKEREAELLRITTGTNRLSLYRNVAQELLKVGDSVVQVSFERDGKIITRPVELHTWEVYRRMPKAPAKPLWEELEKGIWYVRFCAISNPDTLRHLFRTIQQARAVIWEMRAYPNYQVTTELSKFLFPAQTLLTEETNAADYYPGTFVKSPYYFTPAGREALMYKGPLIVLVDEHTQSLAESVSAMLKLRSNTVTMGRQTAGTTGNITWLPLPGGLEVSYTGVGVKGAAGSFEQGKGVKLDIPVKLTRKRIVQSRDHILEQAVQYARKYKA